MNEQLISEISALHEEVKSLRCACKAIAVVNLSTEQLLKAALTSSADFPQPLLEDLQVLFAVPPSFHLVSRGHPGDLQFPPVDLSGSGEVDK